MCRQLQIAFESKQGIKNMKQQELFFSHADNYRFLKLFTLFLNGLAVSAWYVCSTQVVFNAGLTDQFAVQKKYYFIFNLPFFTGNYTFHRKVKSVVSLTSKT